MAPVGTRTIFAGVVAEVDTTNTTVVLNVNDYRSLMQYQMPRHLYQAPCRHTLFDLGCQLNAGSFAVQGAAAGGSSAAQIIAVAPLGAPGSGTFTLGQLQMTSGLNAGYRTMVKAWDGGTVFGLMIPFPFPVTAGDTFVVYPGCDKQFSTCGRFNNQANFGGFKDIPAPETAVT
jgi:uncharacterized phage protein (TIGR02218 family)